MKRYLSSVPVSVPVSVLLLLAAGCASGPQFVDQMQPTATGKAEASGRFSMDCPDAKGEVINREQLEPLAFGGPIRAQYTIGVAGCGKRTMVTVLCSDNGDQC